MCNPATQHRNFKDIIVVLFFVFVCLIGVFFFLVSKLLQFGYLSTGDEAIKIKQALTLQVQAADQ